jgi:hypothetical protein
MAHAASRVAREAARAHWAIFTMPSLAARSRIAK